MRLEKDMYVYIVTSSAENAEMDIVGVYLWENEANEICDFWNKAGKYVHCVDKYKVKQ